MRILLDEDRPSAPVVRLAGWAGIKNGKLLALAAGKFDPFLTMDQNLEYQQNRPRCPSRYLSSARSAIAWNTLRTWFHKY